MQLLTLKKPLQALPSAPGVWLQIPNEGSLVLVVALIVLQGVTGIAFGLVISAAIDDEQSANQAALGVFYPNLVISGTLRAHCGTHVSLSTLRSWKTFFELPRPCSYSIWSVHSYCTSNNESGCNHLKQ